MKKFAKILTPLLSGVFAVGILATCNIENAAANAPDAFAKRAVRENKGNTDRGESKYETPDGKLEPGDRGGVDDADKPGNGPKSKGDDTNGKGKGQYDHKPGRDRDDDGAQKPDRNRNRDEFGNKPGGCTGSGKPGKSNNNGCKPQRQPQNSGCSNPPPRDPRPAPGGCGGGTGCCSPCGNNQQGQPNMGGPGRPNSGNNPPGMDRGNAPFDKSEHRERGGRPDFNNRNNNGKGKGKEK